MNYAMIINGVVDNVTIIDDAEQIPGVERLCEHLVLVPPDLDPQPQIGWVYDGKDFIPADAPPEDKQQTIEEVLKNIDTLSQQLDSLKQTVTKLQSAEITPLETIKET